VGFAQHPPNPDCAIYLTYPGGGAFAATVTDQNGNKYTGAISYQCGKKLTPETFLAYQFCVECPPTSSQSFVGSIRVTSTSAIIATSNQLNCTAFVNPKNYVVCQPAGNPNFFLPPFVHFTIQFINSLSLRNRGGPHAVVSGDPHFIGLKGQDFDFQGEREKIFNIFSDKYTSLNAYLSDPWHNKHKVKTYMTQFGLTFHDVNVVIKSELFTAAANQIIVNGVTVTLPTEGDLQLGEAPCLKAYLASENILHVESNYLLFEFHYLGHYFNFGMRVTPLENVTALGGVIGLTERDDFLIQNYPSSDFEEDTLTSFTSKYNAFQNIELDCSVHPAGEPKLAHGVHDDVYEEEVVTSE